MKDRSSSREKNARKKKNLFTLCFPCATRKNREAKIIQERKNSRTTKKKPDEIVQTILTKYLELKQEQQSQNEQKNDKRHDLAENSNKELVLVEDCPIIEKKSSKMISIENMGMRNLGEAAKLSKSKSTPNACMDVLNLLGFVRDHQAFRSESSLSLKKTDENRNPKKLELIFTNSSQMVSEQSDSASLGYIEYTITCRKSDIAEEGNGQNAQTMKILNERGDEKNPIHLRWKLIISHHSNTCV